MARPETRGYELGATSAQHLPVSAAGPDAREAGAACIAILG